MTWRGFPAGYNTVTYSYPETVHGHEPFFNQFDEIAIPEHTWNHPVETSPENMVPDIALVY